jgi:superfamily II DNA or RNA helicase
MRTLELPRPRLLLADDVGLGKTIEAGLILLDLAARRRANRILIVVPAGIMNQWQRELQIRFGFRFKVFDSDAIHETRTHIEIGANPWAVESRVIASMDLIKRREGAFRELSSTRWDVIIVDEAHHLSGGRNEDDVTDRYRLGRWLSEATDALILLTATPHDGYDESFAALLGLLEPSLVAPDRSIRFSRYRHNLVRRLKGHIRNADGSEKFIRRSVEPIAVELNPAEAVLHAAVMAQASEMESFALQARGRPLDAEAIRLVATILRKRAASSLHALERTLIQRAENLQESLEEIEIQRDYLRALRRGETVSDESLSRLERDAHRSYLSVIRRLGVRLRHAEDELSAIEELKRLLTDCIGQPESKMVSLIGALREIHVLYPGDKVIIFSEYADTLSAIAQSLRESPEYSEQFVIITGDLNRAERERVLAEFATPRKLLLLATDAAGEGLNLQQHCHRIIHFELPWNPNRLEQRNGRIDRYGQKVKPIIGFLYAQDTYEGEVLFRLVDKIERQIERLGSVGDVLGLIQAQRIEEIIARSPTDVRTAIQTAEREIEEEISRTENSSLCSLLGDGTIDEDEVQRAQNAAERGCSDSVDLIDFLDRAVLAAHGRFERAETIRVETPHDWFLLSQALQSHYENLLPPTMDLPEGEGHEKYLDQDHPLLTAAVRWVKGRRFDPTDDHRLAYICSAAISEPDLVATFIVQLRDGEGMEIERLEAVRVASNGEVSTDHTADFQALQIDGGGNISPATLNTIFGPWWQSARGTALAEALLRATEWRRAIIAARGLSQSQLQEELRQWDQATKQAILGEYATAKAQLGLFGKTELPPAVKRRLRNHEERIRQRQDYLDRRIRFDDPSIEPLGVLLRLPTSVAQGTPSQEGGRA